MLAVAITIAVSPSLSVTLMIAIRVVTSVGKGRHLGDDSTVNGPTREYVSCCSYEATSTSLLAHRAGLSMLLCCENEGLEGEGREAIGRRAVFV